MHNSTSTDTCKVYKCFCRKAGPTLAIVGKMHAHSRLNAVFQRGLTFTFKIGSIFRHVRYPRQPAEH
jgi:hypothetical protein